MAESRKGTSTSAKPKEKTSDLDEEVGKDFFSSWKSMSVTDGDMNFSFDTVDTAPKSKKKAFNFDKLDMEFNLDSDFGKLGSFGINMPDLAFTSPQKKSANSKEKSHDEDSAGKRQKKPDNFAFSFDFSELGGDFNFGSSLMNGGKTNNKELGGKGMASDGDDCEASENELMKGIDSFGDGILTELTAKENPANTKIDTSKNSPEEQSFMSGDSSNKEESGHSCPSDSVSAKTSVLSPLQKIDDSNAKETDQPGPALKKPPSMSHGPKVSLHRIENDSPEETDQRSPSPEGQLCQKKIQQKIETNTNETNQPMPSEENHVSSDLFDQHEFEDPSTHSISGNDLSQETASDMLAEFCSQTRKVDPSSVPEENTDMKMTSYEGSTPSELQAKNSSLQPESDKVHLVDSGVSISNQVNNLFGPSQNDPDQESNPMVSRETLHATRAAKNIENSSLKLLSVSDSEAEVGKSAAAKYREAGAVRSRFFKTTEGTEPASTSDRGFQDPNTIFLTEDLGETESHIAGRSTDKSKPVPKEIMSRFTREPNSKNLQNVRGSVKLNAAQESRLPEKSMKMREPTSIRSEKNTRLQGLGQQATASLTHTFKDPKLAVSSAQSAQIRKVDSGMNKVVKNSAELSRLQLPRTVKANPVLSGSGENETDSLRGLEQIKDLSGTTSKLVHTVRSTEKRTPSTSSLKRKIEESYADLIPLKPFKRLSERPSESGKHGEPSEQFANKQSPNPEQMNNSEIGYPVTNPEQMNNSEIGNPSIIDDHPICEAGVSWTVDTIESESSSPMEGDEIVEKAEEYTKALEEICKMLGQKEEEAKELLVRAIVNNNNLLMLNHPVYDEELGMAQEFAKLLISKELPEVI